jgi:uroporphyrinogen-III synthase
MSTQPLAGRRVLVTRAAHQAGKLSQALRTLGVEPVEVPVLAIRPPADFAPLDLALHSLDSYDWLIFTSANTVRALTDRAAVLAISLGSVESERQQTVLRGHGLSRAEGMVDGAFTPEGALPKIAAIGEATAMAARDLGLAVALVPSAYVAESLIETLVDRVAGKKILLARAAVARDVIPDALRAVGAAVDVVDAYRNVMPEIAPKLLRKAMEKGIDGATFTSSSSVTNLAEAARQAGISFPFAGVRAISIGPITSRTLRDLGWEPAAEANPHDVSGLVAATEAVLR